MVRRYVRAIYASWDVLRSEGRAFVGGYDYASNDYAIVHDYDYTAAAATSDPFGLQRACKGAGGVWALLLV